MHFAALKIFKNFFYITYVLKLLQKSVYKVS